MNQMQPLMKALSESKLRDLNNDKNEKTDHVNEIEPHNNHNHHHNNNNDVDDDAHSVISESSSRPSSTRASMRKKVNNNNNNNKNNDHPEWTGGAPRVIVVRNKIGDIKSHEGMIHIRQGIEYQKQEEWKKAVKCYKTGIAILETSLNQIDRGLLKREWKQSIEDLRHKMSRCMFEIDKIKRKKFIKKKEKKD